MSYWYGVPQTTTNLLRYGGIVSLWGFFPNKTPKISIKINVLLSNLTLYEYPYSDYQKFLISKILDLRSQGWNDPQISKWFNENGYMSVRGKRLKPNHVWGIIDKYRKHQEKVSNKYKEDITKCEIVIEE